MRTPIRRWLARVWHWWNRPLPPKVPRLVPEAPEPPVQVIGTPTGYTCRACRLAVPSGGDRIHMTLDEMVRHLSAHRLRGHRVPDGLAAEAVARWAETYPPGTEMYYPCQIA